MKPMIFIGDVAGEFQTLLKLVAKCPQDREILLLGDLNDRGLQTREVIEWAMSEPRVDSLHSNHGDLMVDWWLGAGLYQKRIWLTHNGGHNTLYSYGAEQVDRDSKDEKLAEDERHRDLIPSAHIAWLNTRPVYREGDGWIATHAPINPSIPFERFIDIHHLDILGIPFDDSAIWNVGATRRRDKYQIHGHRHGLKLYKDQRGEFGCGIDTSNKECLTAFLWPEKTFVQMEFVR